MVLRTDNRKVKAPWVDAKTKDKASTMVTYLTELHVQYVCVSPHLCRHMFVSIPLSVFIFVQAGTMLGDKGGKCNL